MVILTFLLRVFPNRWFRTTTILLFLQIFQCTPISFSWQGWKGDYGPHKCFSIELITFAVAILSIAQQVIILVLPIPLLVGLNMGWRKKAGILLFFSLGIFIFITSCVRLKFLSGWARSLNPTCDYMNAFLWTGLEVNVSVIVVCLPAIRILIMETWHRVWGLTVPTGTQSKRTTGHDADRIPRTTDNSQRFSRHASHHERMSQMSTMYSSRTSRSDFASSSHTFSELELCDTIQDTSWIEISSLDEKIVRIGCFGEEAGVCVQGLQGGTPG